MLEPESKCHILAGQEKSCAKILRMDLPKPRIQLKMYVSSMSLADPPCSFPSHQEHVKNPLDAAGPKKHMKMKGIDGVIQ